MLALIFGGLAAAVGVLTYAVAVMLLSVLPGSTVTQPETPLGYLVFPLLLVLTLGPFLLIPGSLLAGIWVVLLRRIVGPASPA